MCTRSSSNLIVESFTIPKRHNRRRSKQIVEPELRTIVEIPVATMADTRIMSELLQAPIEGYGDAIVIPTILFEDFELKVGLLQLVTSSQFHGFERDNPHAHIPAGGNLLNRSPRDASMIIENKSKVRTSRNKPIVSKVSTTTFSPSPSPDVIALTEIVKELVLMKKATQQATVIAIEDTWLESCMALADLGASINLMPLSVWKKLSLPDLTPTRMTLELATRSFAYPAGIADDVFVQVGKFTFPADFVVVDYDVDPNAPFILGRLFLRTAHALVDVHQEELILSDGDEQLIFHGDSTSKNPHKHGNESVNMINFIDITCEDRFLEVLKFKKLNHPSSGSTTPLSESFLSLIPFETIDSLLEEFANKLTLLDPFPSGNKDNNSDFEADLRKIKYLLNQDPSTESNIKIIDPIFEKFTDERALYYSCNNLLFQPVAPRSPDYVPGPEHPPSLDYVPGPEHPPSPYVPELEYPEYLAPSDDEAPLEDQPLLADALPIAASPDYVADSDPEEDPEEDPEDDQADYPVDGGDGDDEPSDDDDDDDDTDDENPEEEPFEEDDEKEEEYPAPADSYVVPIVDLVLSAGDKIVLNLPKISQKPDNINTRSEIRRKSQIRKQFY
nr:reverse transcriptase domain-containing protein [Tanacetum cinerariifolium]